jgi:hypothetical protein
VAFNLMAVTNETSELNNGNFVHKYKDYIFGYILVY